MVMPSWAPESWNDSSRRPGPTVAGRRPGPDLGSVDRHQTELGGDEERVARGQQREGR
jgi:hypothetical protein